MAKQNQRSCQVFFAGQIPYETAWELQQHYVTARRAGTIGDCLILLEHDPVYTIGRAGGQENIKVSLAVLQQQGLTVVETDRGGDITYHGPGQLVGYPILDLTQYGRDVHRYVGQLEAVIIRTLADYGIYGWRESGLTGVWTKAGKVAAIGIGVRAWISMHGFALNVNPDMNHFAMINPCGIVDRATTAMAAFGVQASVTAVGAKLLQHFAAEFGLDCINANPGGQ